MSGKRRVFATSDNGQLEYVSLTQDRLHEALEVLQKSFFPYENVCRVVGLADSPDAIAAYEESVVDIARSGVSVIAIDKTTDKVVGISLNMIEEKNTSNKELLEEYMKYSMFPEIQAFTKVAMLMNDGVDPFTLYKIDCLMELVFLGVLPSYSNKGIGYNLTVASITLANFLYKGENVKTSLDQSELPLDPRPQILTSIFTNYKTQQIGKKLNFTVLKSISYDDLQYKERTYRSVLGCDSDRLTYECTKIG